MQKEADFMCGRYNFINTGEDDMITSIVELMERSYPGEYKTGEIFPGDTAPAIILRQGKIVPVPAVFGFPGFEDGKLLINARAETAAQKKTFSQALRETRAIIPANGFFEWSHDQTKTKYLFETTSRKAMYLCGLYREMDGQRRFVILTREANESMKEIHNRMPVILEREQVRAYLTDDRAAQELLCGPAPMLRHEKAEQDPAKI